MTAVLLYPSIPGVGHHGPARLELEAVAGSPSSARAVCLGGTPKRDHARTLRANPGLSPHENPARAMQMQFADRLKVAPKALFSTASGGRRWWLGTSSAIYGCARGGSGASAPTSVVPRVIALERSIRITCSVAAVVEADEWSVGGLSRRRQSFRLGDNLHVARSLALGR
jgi:hypothetical protein